MMLLKRAQQRIRLVRPSVASPKAWAILAHCFARHGDLRTARACAVRTAGDPYAVAKAWAAIAAASNDMQALQRARRSCQQLRDPFFRAKAHLIVFNACGQRADLDAARTSAQHIPDTYFRGKAYSDIARATNDARDRSVAERCARALGTGYLGRRLRATLPAPPSPNHGGRH
ncbi:MAG: hypothetical protein Q8R16_01220 [bacterium]|nr:hypothetical protein [bacterium]